MEYHSDIKKNEIMPFAARWMDQESVILSEVKSEKEKYCVTSLICGIEKEMIQTEKRQTTVYTTERDRLPEQNSVCQQDEIS